MFVCGINHKGCAPSMEAQGTACIFARSTEKNKLRMVTFHGDGDSKRFTAIQYIYRLSICMNYECIGHAQKRVACRLRKRRKGVKVLGRAWKLTNKMTDKYQSYCGTAIRQNSGKSWKK